MSYSSNGRGRSYHGQSQFRRGPRGPQRSKIHPSRYISEAVATPVVAQEQVVVSSHFSDFQLDARLLENVKRRGYHQPTPIQEQAIPALLSGRDVVGIANTGTGKTAAFLLPLVDKVLADPTQGVLILAPTRELAIQIFEELKALVINLPIGIAPCIGGMHIGSQIKRLSTDPHFVVGTPGRIKDLLNRRAFRSEMYTNIVLDEVDRMLDIGFRADILFLISKLPPKYHAALFSATMNSETQKIIDSFLTDPVTISVKKQETSRHIEQDIVTIEQGQNKVDVLHELLLKSEFEKVIVFGRTKHGINKLEKQLFTRGIRVSAIHGNKNQNARQRSLQAFKQGKVQALLATDIAARGIDVDGVTHVINFDEPMTYEDYVHRIGRTGRAGKTGTALTFVSR